MGITTQQWKDVRQKARTDLIFLAKALLGYRDASYAVHGGLVNSLQKFKGGTEGAEAIGPDRIRLYPGTYRPACDKWDLQGFRKTLLLMARGHLKTTVATIAYGIQWILNYPDIRILLSSATGDQVAGFLREMKSHFQVNEQFRFYFPEFCPHNNVKEFGNQECFSVPNRGELSEGGISKEFTVKTVSVGAVVASAHYDVVINDDIVDKENIRTPDQIANVKSHMGYLWPLVETAPNADKRADGLRRGWWQVTGTPYDFSDAYASVQDHEDALPEGSKTYHIYRQSALLEGELSEDPCGRNDCGIEGKHQLIDHAKTLWPERMPPRALLEIAKDPLQGWNILAAQYLMNPIPEKSGLISSKDEIVWIPIEAMKKIYAYLSLHVTVDLAGMEPSSNKLADNDYTVITPHGFGHDGTLYILPIIRGRMDVFEVINQLFMLIQVHPRLMDIKIEKEAHWRVLKPFVKREEARRRKWLPIVDLQRDNRTSKQHRIKGLQPWFRNGSIKFQDNQPHKLAIINEIMRFPKYAHDDILDTIADAMQNRDGGVTQDVVPMGKQTVQDPNRPILEDAQWLQDRIWGQLPEDEQRLTVDPMTGW